MTPAYQDELMLVGWTDSHNGGAKVTFLLPNREALECFRHMTVKKGNIAGQRFAAVLVEIGDDEQPVKPTTDVATAAMLCKAEDFQRFVFSKLQWPYEISNGEEREKYAARYVREFCRVESRSQIADSPTAQQLFAVLMDEYRAWKAPTMSYRRE